ncbi:hypothetical protein BH09BAC6_BH09BAC6_35440 [soil metagenome]|jgi:hypothetical protein
MKKYCFFIALFFIACCLMPDGVKAQAKSLKLVFIRHGERPENGDNLNCQGLNRSMQLPGVLYKKFGKPGNIYVPSLKLNEATKRARMFQTITPFAAKYNLNINSEYAEEDYKHFGKALLKESGTIIIVWEHNNIVPVLSYLGVKTGSLKWADTDFDSMWIVTFPKGSAVLTKDKEGLKPSPNCPF